MAHCRFPVQMAASFAYLTNVLLYLLPGQATFNGLPLNQQLLLSPQSGISQPLGVIEPNVRGQVLPRRPALPPAALTRVCWLQALYQVHTACCLHHVRVCCRAWPGTLGAHGHGSTL